MATFKANKMLNPPGENVPLLQGSPLESLLNLHVVLEELFKTAGARKFWTSGAVMYVKLLNLNIIHM